MRWVLRAAGAAALSGSLIACAAITGLDRYSADDACLYGCDGPADTSVPSDAVAPGSDAADATGQAMPDGDADAEATSGETGLDDASGEAGCSAGLVACDAGCASLATPQNCGACGNACSTALPNSVATCADGNCGVECSEGFSMCNGSCVQYSTAANCGTCGSACDPDGGAPLCAATAVGTYSCVPACPTSTPTLCGEACVDTTSDRDNCNGCGNVCTTDVPHAQAVCVRGACTFACAAGYQACNGACVQYATAANCGSCGNACNADAGTGACAGSNGSYSCVSGCPATATLCSGTCVDTSNDANNCNGCGITCADSVASAQPVCESAHCTFICSAGTTLCNGACVALTTAANCGACGTVCATEGGTPVCAAGTDGGAYSCASGCPAAASTRCGGACVDAQTDTNNCGACGRTCSTNVANAQPGCVGGACTFTCDPGFTLCNGVCANFANDPNNCGGCGSAHACSGGMTCHNGQCTTTCTFTSDCPPGYACNGGTCTTACSATQACNGGCCANGTCVTGTAAAACGTNGGACNDCATQGTNKACVAGLCGCNAATDCASMTACSLAIHSCQSLCGGANTGCNGGCCTNMAGGQCMPGNVDNQCGGTGGQCGDCTSTCGPGPHCISEACGCITSIDCLAFSACGARLTCSASACQ